MVASVRVLPPGARGEVGSVTRPLKTCCYKMRVTTALPRRQFETYLGDLSGGKHAARRNVGAVDVGDLEPEHVTGRRFPKVSVAGDGDACITGRAFEDEGAARDELAPAVRRHIDEAHVELNA